MDEDTLLLRRFAAERSEAAFAELLRTATLRDFRRQVALLEDLTDGRLAHPPQAPLLHGEFTRWWYSRGQADFRLKRLQEHRASAQTLEWLRAVLDTRTTDVVTTKQVALERESSPSDAVPVAPPVSPAASGSDR